MSTGVRRWVVPFAVVGAVTAVLMIAMATGSGSAPEDADRPDGFTAQVMCEEFVKDRLKAPSTADFSGQEFESAGDLQWTVIGVVDAENSFGAMLRSSYSCEVRYLGNDQWRALSVQLDD